MRSRIGQRQFSNDGSHSRSCADAARGATRVKKMAKVKMSARRLNVFMVGTAANVGDFMQERCENIFDIISNPSRALVRSAPKVLILRSDSQRRQRACPWLSYPAPSALGHLASAFGAR